ncbi:MAG: exodeoxyribonuclease VII large subunit, partial [Nitrospirota bacterium]
MTIQYSERKVYTVYELTLSVKSSLEEGFSDIWLEGEVSNLRIPGSGHIYLTLKDERAQIRGIIFRSQVRSLRFLPKDGQRLLCRGHITVYEPKGEYQIIFTYIEPKGLGALQQAFEELKERLKSEGLFDEARKRPLPLYPEKIGVVTSPTGAAIRDILNIIGRRFPAVDILINPVPVQGEGAAELIAEAVNEMNLVGDIDVLIVTRGGGSIEDLWAFNEEIVARAIYNSRIPVISAIGHEIDYTISDFVADLRAPTPSAAAEIVVRSRDELVEKVDAMTNRIVTRMIGIIHESRGRIQEELRGMPDLRRMIEGCFLRVDEYIYRLNINIS